MSGKPDIYTIRHNPERAAKPVVRLGMIGVGGVAQAKHLPSIARLRTRWEPVELVAVADPDEASGRKIASLFGARWYADHREMLVAEDLEAVDIATPDQLHAEQVAECLASGRHVLVEKPLTADAASSSALCRQAEDAGLVLMTAFCKRFAEPYDRAKRLIIEGAIGRPAMLAAKMTQAWAAMGLLERQCCHLFDIMRYFMGDVVEVTAYGIKAFRDVAYPIDNLTVNMRFESGAIGSFHASSTALSYHPWERVEVYGEHRWLIVDDQRSVTLYDGEDAPAKIWAPTFANTVLMDEEFGGYVGEIDTFLAAVRGDAPPPSAWDGYHALAIAEAIHASIREHRAVAVATTPSGAVGRAK